MVQFSEATSITEGVTDKDVETLLDMAAASGLFNSEVMMSVEDMAWDSAYGDGSEPHRFLKASMSLSGHDKLVGFIAFGPVPHWHGNYELFGIAVEPEFHRLGIGSALLLEMCRQIANQGGLRVYLETGEDRRFEGTRLFYEANSFSQEVRYIKQFTPNEGGVVYRHDIEIGNGDEQYQ